MWDLEETRGLMGSDDVDAANGRTGDGGVDMSEQGGAGLSRRESHDDDASWRGSGSDTASWRGSGSALLSHVELSSSLWWALLASGPQAIDAGDGRSDGRLVKAAAAAIDRAIDDNLAVFGVDNDNERERERENENENENEKEEENKVHNTVQVHCRERARFGRR